MKRPHVLRGVSGQYVISLGLLSLFAITLSGIRIISSNSLDLWFLVWNLFLAWLPLVFAWLLYRQTRQFGLVWSKTNLLWGTLWLLFLPNAFYLITDFVHLSGETAEELMFDTVLLFSYAITGLILGYTSLALVHKRLLQRFGTDAHIMVVGALLASSFAIYIGRYLRWNSWDVIVNPFGLLFDISERIINPSNYAITYTTTGLFFGLLGLLYLVFWQLVKVIQTDTSNHTHHKTN